MGLMALPAGAAEVSPFATKPGQWEMKTQHNGKAMPTIRSCVDEETAAQAEKTLASPEIPKECKLLSQQLKGQDMRFEYLCDDESGPVHVRGQGRRLSESAFESRLETLENGQVVGTTVIAGQWLGTCPAQGGNTMDIPGVGQMDMDQLERMAKEPGGPAGY
jgi:hypothetical protein